jgi:hypothetical protein
MKHQKGEISLMGLATLVVLILALGASAQHKQNTEQENQPHHSN